jgi:hypothetical protein
LLVHRGGKLRGDDFLDGVILARSQHALIGKEVVKGLLAHAAFPFLGHHLSFAFQGKVNARLRRVLRLLDEAVQ